MYDATGVKHKVKWANEVKTQNIPLGVTSKEKKVAL